MDITPSHIELLRTTFDAVKGINPSGSAYKNLVRLLDNLSQSSLKKLANARIKFVSPLAKNRLNKNEMLNKPNYIRNVAPIPANQKDGEHQYYNPEVEEDKIPGGLAKGMSLNDIAEKHNVDIEVLKKEFVKGVKTEMEHTTDKEVAKEIALDHIFEDPKYYTKLATIEEDWSDKYKRSIDCNNPKGFSQKAHCQGRKKQENKMSETIQESLNLFFEENKPTDPSKWAYYKAQAKKKFDVYPSAYANGWAAKQYKAAGGGWRKSKSESYDIWAEDGSFGYTMAGLLPEAEYQGRKVKLGKPMQGDVKKFKVYVKNPQGNVVKVNFGQGGDAKGGTMKIRKSNPKARKSFRARHNCDNPGPRHKARYWSCRKW